MHATIVHVSEGTIAEQIGLKKGDVLLSINNHPIGDIIDYMFYSRDNVLNLKIRRNNKEHTIRVKKKDNVPIGLEIKQFRTKTCRNKCVFCFIRQLPKGMRKTLYLKDDDYRMSFLFGNYITLSNLSNKDKQRIREQRLSPLYVSVHTTNNAKRRKLLGNPKAPDIIHEIKELTSYKIRIHAQIVVCPGVNDGDELAATINDLYKFYPYVASIAIVPVGLTRFSKSNLRPVKKEEAVKIIESVKYIRRRLKKRHGDPIVYIADEFYLKADLPFPSLKDYGDLPQAENGVGLISRFIRSAKQIRLPKKIDPVHVATFTGVSFMPFLEEFAVRLRTIEGLSIELFKVTNKFFGPTVTVTGLLTGKDIVRAVMGKTKADTLLVPNVALRSGSGLFLDNVSFKDLEESLGMNVYPIDPSPEGLLEGILYACKRKN